MRSVYLKPSQLMRVPPPPEESGQKEWPLDARFGCALAGLKSCECNAAKACEQPSIKESGVMGPPPPRVTA